jgi:hypothetical protein
VALRHGLFCAVTTAAACSSFSGAGDGPQRSTDGGAEDGRRDDAAGADCVGGCVLAEDLAGPMGIAVSKEHVFWTNWGSDNSDGTVVRSRLDGAEPTPIASGLNHPWPVTTDGIYVWFAAFSGDIYRCPVAGCPSALPAVPHAQGWGARSLAAAGANLVWSRSVQAAVTYCPIASCDYSTDLYIATEQLGVYGVAANASAAFWTNEAANTVATCPYEGCPDGQAPLVSGLDRPTGIALGASEVYWVETGAGVVGSCPVTGCGGARTALATGQDRPHGIAIDETNIYWTNTGQAPKGGTVMWCRRAGCDARPLATNLDAPTAIAVDDAHVYVANRGISINGKDFGSGYGGGIFTGGSIVKYDKPGP